MEVGFPSKYLAVVVGVATVALVNGEVPVATETVAVAVATVASVHRPEHAVGSGVILRRGLLEPIACLLVVHSDTDATLAVHEANILLAQHLAGFGADRIRRHCLRVVDLHAVAVLVDVAEVRGCFDVALRGGVEQIGR